MATGGGLPSLLWDVVRRLRLFLEQQTLRDKFGNPSVQGLWDQGVFSDALVSAVVGEYSYSFTWLHSPSAFANRGYDTRSSMSSIGRRLASRLQTRPACSMACGGGETA